MATPVPATELPIELSDAEIKDFQQLYRQHFGVAINRDQAFELGVSLADLLRIIYQPVTKQQFKQAQKLKKGSPAKRKELQSRYGKA